MGRAAFFNSLVNLLLVRLPSARPTGSSSRGHDSYALPAALIGLPVLAPRLIAGRKNRPVTSGLVAAAISAALIRVPYSACMALLP